jgi:hypothetical protein
LELLTMTVISVRTYVCIDTLNWDGLSRGAREALALCIDDCGRQVCAVFAERRAAQAPRGRNLVPGGLVGNHAELGSAWWDEGADALVFTSWA